MKIKFIGFTSLVTSLFLLFSSGLTFAQGVYVSGSVGNDLSWPNCTGKYSLSGKFGVVGVTDGLGYSTNPCIAKEASHFSNLSLYVNTGWDSTSSHINASSPVVCATGNQSCLAYNYGYNAGLYALSAAASAGVRSNIWWLDVETSNTWSTTSVQNQQSLLGERAALLASDVTNVGVYSTTAQWDSVTGSWQNGWPNWGASTWKTAKQAATYCTGHQFTGGPTWLIQFKGSIDQDYAC